MHVYLTHRARKSVLRAALWWRRHRLAAPTLFDDELHEALTMLAHSPLAGVITREVRGRGVRRVSLKQSRMLVYYRVDEAKQVVTVVELWHQNRGRRPKL